MKKFKLFFTALALACGLSASAEVVENYTWDFETAPSTLTTSKVKVAPGWSYLLETVSGGYTSGWTYKTASDGKGVDGSACLQGGYKISSAWSTYNNDYLITPAVTGKMTIAVKKSAASGYVTFFKFNEDGTKGDTLKTATCSAEPSQTEYVTYTIEGLENQKVGIWASSMYLDNFTADQADIQLEKGLTVTAKLYSALSPDCDADGNYTVTYKAVVKNTGECTLEAGTENYQISLRQYSTKEVMATVPVSQTLAVGESSDSITISATLNTAQWPDRLRWDVYEDITNTFAYGSWIEPNKYVPVLKVANSDGTQTSPITKDFSYMNADQTVTYTIGNTGAAPLSITGITTPDEGFSVEVKYNDAVVTEYPLTIAAHTTATMTVTALAATVGTYEKSIVISGTDVDDFTINLKSVVLDANKFYANFENGTIPAGFKYDSNVWSAYYYNATTNKYCLKSSKQFGYDYDYYLATPLLEVAGEDDVMTFEVAKQSQYSDSQINVYYSTDRTNWTLLKEIPASDFGTDKDSTYPYSYLFKQFSVSGIPAGNYYIGFESGYAYLDNIYGFKKVDVDHDMLLTKTTVPTTAMQNNAYTVSVAVKNINDKADNAYAELYVNDTKVATAEAQDVASLATATFTFAPVPHVLGDNTVYCKVIAGTQELTSETATVNVTEEVANAEITVGKASTSLSSSYEMVRPYYKNSQSETVYTAAKCAAAGLKAGDKINKIVLRGTTAGALDITSLKVFIANSETATVTETVTGDTLNMTKVYDDAYSMPATASSSSAQDYAEDVFVINFAEPFTYTGGNLRIAACHSADTYKTFYSEIDNTDDTGSVSYLKCHDTKSTCDSKTMSKQSALPVVHFGLVVVPTTISGTVTDSEGAPLSDATIEVVNDEKDVIYTGTTDEEGKYSINVIQTSLTYTVTCTYESNEKTEENVSFADGSVTKDFQFEGVATGISQFDGSKQDVEDAPVYNLAGQRVKSSAKGIIIRGGKKYMVK